MISPEQQPITTTNIEDQVEEASIKEDRIAAGQLIERLKNRAPSEWHRNNIELLARIGDMNFAAYLMLPNIDPYARELATDFLEDFVNSYDSDEAMAQDFFVTLGLKRAIAETVTDHDIPADAVVVNTPVMAAHLKDFYNVVELAGRVYVFKKK